MRKTLNTKHSIPIFVCLFACAVYLLFHGLSNSNLWQDEAETALLALGLLNGNLVPNAFLNNTIVTQGEFIELTPSGTWAWSPWLMHFVAALSMHLFGQSNLGARFLFVAIALVTLVAVSVHLLRNRRSNVLGVVICLVILLSDPDYILHSRQCRYYSLASLLTFTLYWSFELYPRRLGVVLVTVSSILFFHTNYALFGFCFLSLLVYHVHRLTISDIRIHCMVLTGITLFTLPWFLYLDIASVFTAQKMAYDMPDFLGCLGRVFPMVSHLLIPSIILVAVSRRWGEPVLLLLMICITGIGVSLSTFPDPRHIIHLWPLATVILVKSINKVANDRSLPQFAVVLILCIAAFCVSSNFAYRKHLAELVHSFSSKQPTAVSGLVNYFGQFSEPPVIVTPYGGMSLAFYLGTPVYSAVQESLLTPVSTEVIKRLPSISEVDYLVMRQSWNDLVNFRSIWQELVDPAKSTLLISNIPDFAWEQRESIRYYNFGLDARSDSGPRIKIIKLNP